MTSSKYGDAIQNVFLTPAGDDCRYLGNIQPIPANRDYLTTDEFNQLVNQGGFDGWLEPLKSWYCVGNKFSVIAPKYPHLHS